MKKNKKTSVINEWLIIARKDLERMKRNLKDKDAEAAGFYLQQSLEKYIKAYLLKHGWKLRKIHELDALLDEASKFNPELKKFQNLCEKVSGYYIIDRYPPLVAPELTCEEIEKDIIEAKNLIKAMFLDEKI
jgi:HEPN domain-containing protein